MTKWFKETFLKSLIERAGIEKSMWLSRKQTAICVENMEKHISRREVLQGHQNHSFYTCVWDGREVRLDYSTLNGCGTIFFGYTSEEREELHKLYEERKKQENIERLKRLKERHPDKLLEQLNKLQKRIDEAKEEIRFDKEDFEDGIMTAEEYEKTLAIDTAYLNKLEQELGQLKSV